MGKARVKQTDSAAAAAAAGGAAGDAASGPFVGAERPLPAGAVLIQYRGGPAQGYNAGVGFVQVGGVYTASLDAAARLTAGERPEFIPWRDSDAESIEWHRALTASPAAASPAGDAPLSAEPGPDAPLPAEHTSDAPHAAERTPRAPLPVEHTPDGRPAAESAVEAASAAESVQVGAGLGEPGDKPIETDAPPQASTGSDAETKASES
jgi:hypothetical protein